MKLLAVKYVGLVSGTSKLSVTIRDEEGADHDGFLYFENDGRDMDVEGLDSDYVITHIDDIYSDEEAIKKLEDELEKGSIDYQNLWKAKK